MNKTIVKIALVGGFAALGSPRFIRWKIEQVIKQSQYFQSATNRVLENVVLFL